MTDKESRTLFIGYGNPGRLDDGLGPAMAEAVEKLNLPGVVTDSDYQLTVEDAAEAAKYDLVVFADADVSGPEPFWVKRISAKGGHLSFSSHSVDPRGVLGLAKELFKAEPTCYIFGIRGYDFNEFGEGLSPRARENLTQAVDYFKKCLLENNIKEIRPEGGEIYRQGEQHEEEKQCKTENM